MDRRGEKRKGVEKRGKEERKEMRRKRRRDDFVADSISYISSKSNTIISIINLLQSIYILAYFSFYF